jgi:peptidoglycan/xylan/chitin deacetylase (PgdA/CDA1 family)
MKSNIGIISVLCLMWLDVNAFNRADWPAFGDVPPINKDWTKAALKGQKTFSNNDPDFEECPDYNDWALTYDDGPGQFTDERVLKPLAERNLKATFFVTGQQVANSPNVLKKIHDDGHQIGIHTWSHPELTKLSNDQVVAEIVWTARIIKNITGVAPTMFRPPCKFCLVNLKVGDIDARVRGIIRNLGLSVILWNRDTKGAAFKT